MRRRLVLVAAATTSMVVIAFVVPLALLVRTLAEERALSSAHEVAEVLALTLSDGNPSAVQAALTTAEASRAGDVSVALPDGRTIGDHPIDPVVLDRARAGESLTVAHDGGLQVVTPVGGPNGVAVVQVEVDHETLRAGVTESWFVLGGLGVVLVVGAVLVADRLGRRITRPVTDVAEAARALSSGDHDARARVAGPEEIADVAVALNGLADAIDDLLAAEREAAADLSHRLRTPLTALRLDVETLQDSAATERLAADVARLEEAVDRLIRHARAGTRSRGPSDLASVVQDRIGFWAPLAEDEGRDVTVNLPDGPLPVEVADEDLAAAVDALLGNVLTHTPAGTPFVVSVTRQDGAGRLRVEDQGPGFPQGHVLARGVSSRGSTGLGLDICRRLAEEAGGSLATGTSDEGGARVDLQFPAASTR